MKKLVLILVLGILLISLVSFSLVFADDDDDNESEVSETEDNDDLEDEIDDDDDNETDDDSDSRGLGQTIRNRVKAGIYTNEEGEEIRVSEMAKNRIKLRVRNATADSELEIEEERENNKTKLKVKLSNGRKAVIKIMPDTASETALARLRLKVCSEKNNCTIILKEIRKGDGNETRAAYEMQVERHFRILALFKTKAQVKAQIDAENGEVLVIKKPWWAFLASEPEEAEEE